MDLVVDPRGRITTGARTFRCAVGRGGVSNHKTEGDGATPAGRFPLRRVMYRADRLPQPNTGLPATPLRKDQGWCDDSDHPSYNKPVPLPFAGRHEVLWRADSLYDVIVVVGYNDSPPVPGRGSAIFVHVARPDYGSTDRCVALSLDDLLDILALCRPGDTITISPDGAADVRRI